MAAKFDVSAFMEEQITSIDEAVEKLNKRLAPYDRLREERDKLLAARRALLGGNKLTGAGGNRVRQEDVVDWMQRNEGGHSVYEIAQGINTTEAVARGHLNRGKGERFLQKDRKWWLRDPEAGVNSEDDIEDD